MHPGCACNRGVLAYAAAVPGTCPVRRAPSSITRIKDLSMVFFLLLLAITAVSFWIVFLGGAERVQGLFSLLSFDLIDLFTEPLTAQQVRLCTAITWCIAVVIITVVGLR
jgi:hypothetical protein